MTLAIKGHLTRGKEVIEILKMLGAKEEDIYKGNDTNWVYIINEGYVDWDYPSDKYTIYTLEEFLEKYPYKVGDKVLYKIYNVYSSIKTMTWNEEKEQVIYRLDSKNLWVATADELEKEQWKN